MTGMKWKRNDANQNKAKQNVLKLTKQNER